MSMQTGLAPDSTTSLLSLPHDVLLQLLYRLPPISIASCSQVCSSINTLCNDTSLWTLIAQRHFALPCTQRVTKQYVSNLTNSLVFKWWLASSLLVAGIPVHFRKGFSDVRPRGGTDVSIHHDGSDTCYVFGGRFQQACIPVPVPSVSMDFFLDPNGPFPVDGFTLRLLHASEPLPMLSHRAHSDHSAEHPSGQTGHEAPHEGLAKVCVKFNDTVLVQECFPPPLRFSVLDVHVGPELLKVRPSVNTLVVEYDRSSDAAYWLREVHVVPSVLPMPKVEEEKLEFVVRAVPERHAPLQLPLLSEDEEEEEEEEEEELRQYQHHNHNYNYNQHRDQYQDQDQDQQEEHTGSSPRFRDSRGRRRAVSSGPSSPPPQAVPGSPKKGDAGGRKGKGNGKKNKIVYHHHGQHRMPRGGMSPKVRR